MSDATARTSRSWTLRDREIPLDRPVVLGVVNVTPDSFSDGGQHDDPDRAVAHAQRLVEEGADVLDVGGESTRPQGATPVDAAEELRRILPVIRRLRSELAHVPISIDTTKSAVARAALEEGASIVNDVAAFRLDDGMARTCAEARCGVILMHSRGGVQDMATFRHARYGDVVEEVRRELLDAVAAARAAGIAPDAVVLDPGIGFAKESAHSLAVLARLDELAALGFPLLVGVSRKRFIGEITQVTNAADRVEGTLGANVIALARGARLFRVHDVRASRRALDVAWAILRAGAVAPEPAS